MLKPTLFDKKDAGYFMNTLNNTKKGSNKIAA
jgi:hypothetical protein